jgi:hypothetical protein
MTSRTRLLLITIASIIAAVAACLLGLPWLANTMKEMHGG